ncbi:hypothetical protein RFW18_08955 [Metabacillus idriensis]|uniref:hypothetical protein n=1 Tax=Metabacillus idriensis TaxID=324768 RepID=UPI00281427F5|nr:hypothetical protein [Metabacillus idriensis]MDR0137873.1 hypothetical protein [Metabacillus idriensis]
MKKEYFVQYSDQSIINSFDFPNDAFVSITIGMTDITNDFIISLVHKMFGLPVFFVLNSMIFGYEKETLISNNIPFYEFSSDGGVIKVDSIDKLHLISKLAEELVCNGLSVFIFHGKDLSEQDLIPPKQWLDKPIVFKNLDINKVETFVDVEEVGFTIFTKSSLFNSPEKIPNYISSDYLLDINNSDI